MNKRIFLFAIIAISLNMLCINNGFAQACAPLVISGGSTTAATCPSSGNITVSATGTGLTYQIISGPSGYPPASNSTGIFNGLGAGNYTIEVKDACGATSNISRTVTNAYPAFGVSSATASNVCTSGTQGGTITGNVGGGKSPYQYDIVPVGTSPVYGANTTATSYMENVATFGTYRFYAKDACGEVRTYDVNVQPLQPTPVDIWWEDIEVDRPCTELIDGLPTVTWQLHIYDDKGSGVNFHNLIGSTYQIYKPTPANSINGSNVNCNNTLGALLVSGTIVAANIPSGSSGHTYPIAIPQEDVILVFTNTCGQSFKYCYNFNEGAPITPDASFQVLQKTCNAVWSNQNVFINKNWVNNMTAPITYLLTLNGGATITNSTGYFYDLNPSNFPATILVTDACGKTVNRNLTMPVQGSAIQAAAEPQWNFACTFIKNTATAYIRVNGGDLQGIVDATNVTITGGTVAAVPGISTFQSWLPGYTASNLLAGYSYKIRVVNQCGEADSILFTVPNDHWEQPILNWNLVATANALCGQNKSTITAVTGFTGPNTLTYYLYNLTAPNTAIDSNTSGVFSNVVPGDYKVKFIVWVNNSKCPTAKITDSVNLTVLGDATAQTITRKVITNCESGSTVLATGKATVEVNGSAPFTYEIIKTNLIGTAGESWVQSSTGNPSNTYTWDLPLSGDPSNTIYSFRSTDKCGNKVTTQGAMQPLATPVLQSSLNPCPAQLNYTIAVVPYPGNYTYRWVKLPDLVTTLSTQNSLTFPGAYTASNNGTYRCYVSLPGCVDRTRDVTISSAACGSLLPVTLVSFTGSLSNSTATLKWQVESESQMKSYDVEKSHNGTDFTFIYSIAAKNNGQSHYSFDDNGISNPVIYYRLKIVDKDGKYRYSNVIRLNNNGQNSGLELYPNPAKNNLNVNFHSGTSSAGSLKILSYNGSPVYTKDVLVTKGNNNISITSIENLPAGTYILELTHAGKKARSKFVKL